jgi:hypothetical protein
MPTTGNVIKNIMHSLKSTYLWLWQNITKITQKQHRLHQCPLSYLSNQPMAAEAFPEWLKYSNVKACYKKGKKSCIFNYRPI